MLIISIGQLTVNKTRPTPPINGEGGFCVPTAGYANEIAGIKSYRSHKPTPTIGLCDDHSLTIDPFEEENGYRSLLIRFDSQKREATPTNPCQNIGSVGVGLC